MIIKQIGLSLRTLTYLFLGIVTLFSIALLLSETTSFSYFAQTWKQWSVDHKIFFIAHTFLIFLPFCFFSYPLFFEYIRIESKPSFFFSHLAKLIVFSTVTLIFYSIYQLWQLNPAVKNLSSQIHFQFPKLTLYISPVVEINSFDLFTKTHRLFLKWITSFPSYQFLMVFLAASILYQSFIYLIQSKYKEKIPFYIFNFTIFAILNISIYTITVTFF